MADENTPVEQPTPAAAPARKVRTTKKAKKRTKVTKTETTAPRVASAGMPAAALIGVYVILGLLALGLSFYTGYLVGKNTSSPGTTQTGSQIEGKLQIIEYSDFQCPFCSRAVPTVEQIKQTYGDKVDVVYKEFPLESIHPNAFNAAIAAECVRKYEGDEGFWKMHDILFANQNALDVPSLKKYAQQVSSNSDVITCIDNKETEAKIRADQQEALSRGVQGTPSFWIQDELVVGALPFEAFQQKIDAKLRGEKAAPAPTAPAAPEAPSAPVNVTPGKNVMGDAKAPVEIVEFSDFQCPFCKRFYDDTEKQLVDNYVKTGKARLSYRHFPLSFHQNAQNAAEASECAAAQGKFWQMHDIMFERGSGDGTGLNVADLKSYAAELKLDTTKFNKCLDGHEMASKVQQDFSDGQAAGVSGTPSFFINGKQIVGAQPFSAFQSAIDAELQ